MFNLQYATRLIQLIPDDINMSLWAVIPNNNSTNKTEEMRWQKKKCVIIILDLIRAETKVCAYNSIKE
jgi:hypothetical protein